MATVLTTGTNFAKSVTDLLRNEVITGLRAGLPHLPPGVIVPAIFQRGTNGLARFSRYGDLPEAPAASYVLAEGTPPVPQALTQVYDEFQMAQLGASIETSDLADMQHDPAVMVILVERIKRQALAILDDLAKTAWHLTAPTWVIGTSAAVISRQNVLDAVAQLDAANVLRVGASVGADGATQTGGQYLGIVHPYVAADIRAATAAGEWVSTLQYTDPSAILQNELGTAFGVRWISSGKAKWDAATTPDTYHTLIVGQQALAFGDVGTVKVNFIGPEVPDKQDILGQKGIAGFKFYAGGITIKQNGVTQFAKITTKATLGSAS